MTVFTGKSVYDAAVCGLICILRKPKLSAERMHVDDISTELKRVEAARIVAAEQLQQLYELFLDKIGESNAQIFNIHMMMLEDEDYNGSIEGMIRSEQVNAEYAVARTSDVFAQMLEAMDNEYMRARSADVRDVQTASSQYSPIPPWISRGFRKTPWCAPTTSPQVKLQLSNAGTSPRS